QLIATNNHVIPADMDTENLERLVVLSGTGATTRMHQAVFSGSSPEHDLAVIRVDTRIPALKFTNTDQLLGEGENVAFTGFPIGAILGLYPVTHRGLISAITPIATPSSSSSQLSATKISRLRDPLFVYQLDATAYPGNSGSPLYRPDTGEVVGILNMVFVKSTKEDVLSKPSGISYAIPVKYLRSLVQKLEVAKP
ncbi:MAG: serine protease, partial [Halopseudomonas sp.]